MAVALNHLIIPATDKWAAARFLAGILGLEVGKEWGHFVPLNTSNGVTIDFAEWKGPVRPMHYAFLVGEAEFAAGLDRLKRSGAKFYAEFDGSGVGEINHLYGGSGVYFEDADGHMFEMITRPYGPVPERWVDGKAVKSPS